MSDGIFTRRAGNSQRTRIIVDAASLRVSIILYIFYMSLQKYVQLIPTMWIICYYDSVHPMCMCSNVAYVRALV